MVDYWLASRFGRVWLRWHGSLRPLLGGLPGECARVARGEPLSAERLWRAQDFAVRVWWRFGMVSLVPLIPVGLALSAWRHVPWAAALLGWSFLGLVGLATAAMAQGGMIRYRSDRIRLYLLRADPEAAGEPLLSGSPGCPRRSDFWLMLVIAFAGSAILFYAGTPHGH